MCSTLQSEVPQSTLVIEIQDKEVGFGIEKFKLDSNEECDHDVTLATFTASSDNGYQASYYDGCIPSDVIHLSVVTYDETLFNVIS